MFIASFKKKIHSAQYSYPAIIIYQTKRPTIVIRPHMIFHIVNRQAIRPPVISGSLRSSLLPLHPLSSFYFFSILFFFFLLYSIQYHSSPDWSEDELLQAWGDDVTVSLSRGEVIMWQRAWTDVMVWWRDDVTVRWCNGVTGIANNRTW